MTETILQLIADADWVGWALVGLSIGLWLLVAVRALELRRGFITSVDHYTRLRLQDRGRVSSGVVPEFVTAGLHAVREHGASGLEQIATRAIDRLSVHRDLIRALVIAAPLVGLLGTVSGMVETFASLHQPGSSQIGEGTVAGGIQAALVSTQLGLAIG
ncbi:MAG: MotA/TolQ/ExbB proton channel family protein, partial [Deltaproteobacteria bacterium]|nr:MotA/TolQ/ExbB proton channel family protein [Deltaproteobacteria bacterium]